MDEAVAAVEDILGGVDVTRLEQERGERERGQMVRFARWARHTYNKAAAAGSGSKPRSVEVVQCPICRHYGVTSTRRAKATRYRCIAPCPGERTVVEKL